MEDDSSPLAVRSFVADLVEAGAGASTIRNAVKVARLVLGTAVEAGAIRTNPAVQLRGLPRPGRIEALFLSPEQVEILAQAITPPYGTLVRFAAYTGLRAGEIGALRVGRLEMLRGAVRVVESVADVDGHLHFGPTKTYANRRVPMPRFIVEELGGFLAKRPSEPDTFVFTAPDGGPLRHNNFYRRKYKPAVVRASLPGSLRFHDYADLRVIPTSACESVRCKVMGLLMSA